MSLSIHFEPHSHYKGFAIRHNNVNIPEGVSVMINPYAWSAVIDNGNTYRIDTIEAQTLKDLKILITDYHKRQQERDRYNRQLIGEA